MRNCLDFGAHQSIYDTLPLGERLPQKAYDRCNLLEILMKFYRGWREG